MRVGVRIFVAFGLPIALLNGCATEADKAKAQALHNLLLGMSLEERRQACDLMLRQPTPDLGDCTGLPRDAMSYVFQRPVLGVDARPVAITDADWAACDRLGHQVALQWQAPSYDTWIPTKGGYGFPLTIPNPQARATLDQRYEMTMRGCLVRKGYTMVPSYQHPWQGPPSFGDYKRE
jgi:hypothetical protein